MMGAYGSSTRTIMLINSAVNGFTINNRILWNINYNLVMHNQSYSSLKQSKKIGDYQIGKTIGCGTFSKVK